MIRLVRCEGGGGRGADMNIDTLVYRKLTACRHQLEDREINNVKFYYTCFRYQHCLYTKIDHCVPWVKLYPKHD